jgi:uncharacterized membrane protein
MNMSRTLMISMLVYLMVQAVTFGIGVVLLLATQLSAHAMELMPWLVAVTFVVSVPIAWFIAPWLKARREITVPSEGI